MKITKARLKRLIKEELDGIATGIGDSADAKQIRQTVQNIVMEIEALAELVGPAGARMGIVRAIVALKSKKEQYVLKEDISKTAYRAGYEDAYQGRPHNRDSRMRELDPRMYDYGFSRGTDAAMEDDRRPDEIDQRLKESPPVVEEKITRTKLKKMIEEEMRNISQSFRIPYRDIGYGGRRIISRDRAWLEFVPKGAGPDTQEDMFRSVTLLEPDDPEIQKAIKLRGPKDMGSLEQYDVYSVHATTTG